jgi:hypothetical protein
MAGWGFTETTSWPRLASLNSKARTKLSAESLQKFAAAIEQLTHQPLAGLPEDFIHRDAFINGVKDHEVKQHLLVGGERSLNEPLNQTLQLQAAKISDGPPVRL